MTILTQFLGCKVNSYEVECVAKDFINHGYDFFNSDVDSYPTVIVINTCAVTETSVTKDKKAIRRAKREYPSSILVVMGCYSQYRADFIANELDADIVIGTSNRSKIYDLVEEFKKNREKIVLKVENNSLTKYETISLEQYQTNTRAYVKIQDGCDNFCSYCLIPYVRGRSRSRPISSILEEIGILVNNGYKEIVLTGIDMSSYGKDLENKETFSDLIEQILTNFPTLYRLRISSLETSQIDDKFLTLLKEHENLANHLHMPLQSGSRRIIHLMNRKYNLEEFLEKVDKIRQIRPDISITTDVIVGFPDESEDEFNETYEFCKKINFSKIHVFPFSARQGTVANKMKNQIDPNTKKARVNRLLELSTKLENEYGSKFDKQEIEFLFESYDSKLDAYIGHSSNYLEYFAKSDYSLTNKTRKVIYNFDSVKK